MDVLVWWATSAHSYLTTLSTCAGLVCVVCNEVKECGRPGTLHHSVDVCCIDHRRVPLGRACLNKVSKSAISWFWRFQRRRWAAGREWWQAQSEHAATKSASWLQLSPLQSLWSRLRLHCQSWQVVHACWLWSERFSELTVPRRPPGLATFWEETEDREGLERVIIVTDTGFLVAQVLSHSAEPALIAVLKDDGCGWHWLNLLPEN